MTILEERAPLPCLSTRSETDVLIAQVMGIGAWSARHRATVLPVAATVSREAQLDLARRRDVVERQRRAMVDWTAHQLQESDHVLRSFASLRAVLVHRDPWFKGRVSEGLEAAGIVVVADLDNGADAVGVAVAEQPDLLVLEDKLLMVPGLDVTRAVHRYAPGTLVVAQVVSDVEIGPFLEAGATTAYTRRIPPSDLVADLRALFAG